MVDISVVIPVYNSENYILQCIESILRQSTANIEIIIIDDGSTDESYYICSQLALKDGRIKVFHCENMGVSNARNKGLSNAQGKWVCFVDSDDYLDPHMLERLHETANKSDADICICDHIYVHNQYKFKSSFIQENALDVNEKIDKQYLFANCMYGTQSNETLACVGVPWGKLYRREFLKKYDISFKLHLKRNQDVLFNLYAFLHAKSVVYCRYHGYCYRVWSGSAVYKYTNDYDRTIRSFLEGVDNFLKQENATIYITEKMYQKKKWDLYYECLHLQVFHTQNHDSMSMKYQTFLQICTTLNIMSLPTKGDGLSMVRKIQIDLLKCKYYRASFIMHYINDWLRYHLLLTSKLFILGNNRLTCGFGQIEY